MTSQHNPKKRQVATSSAICYVMFQFADEKASTSSLPLRIFGIQIETRIMEQYVILRSLIYYLKNK